MEAKRKEWFKEKQSTRSKADGCLSMLRMKKCLLNLVIWRALVTLAKTGEVAHGGQRRMCP